MSRMNFEEFKNVVVDGIREWLEDYINTNEGSWLWYDLQPTLNTSEYYILVLHLQTEKFKSG